MSHSFTPGPWFSDRRGNIWRRPLSDLYENGGRMAGDKPLAFVAAGWAGKGVTGYPVEDNARLIAAAPDLLEALQEMVAGDAEAIEDAKRLGVPFPDEMLAAYHKARAAIARATGEQP